MARIFVTRQIPGKALEELKRVYEVEVFGDEKISREELLKRVEGVDAILSTVTTKVDDEVMTAAGPGLKIVANYAVGYDNIDLDAARKHKLVVTNTPSKLGDVVAEFTVALVLALSRRIVEADKFVRAGEFVGWGPNLFLGQDLSGKTLGMIGPGTIGAVVGKRLQAVFDMQVVYHCRNRKADFEATTGGKWVSLEELLKLADVVTIHVPLTAETRHMIGAEELAMMKPTAILINTARGPAVEQGALVAALERKQIWGAALDVFEGEVEAEKSHLDPQDWQRLKELPNVILTPHIASATIQAREEMTGLAVESIMKVLAGEEVKNNVLVLRDGEA